MAQPIFDGHPLEEYFQDSGEACELMPGGMADTSFQAYLTGHPSISKHSERMEKLCFLISGMLESLSLFFSSDRMSLRTQAFAERFKYGVISSSLLSPAFATTPMVEPKRALPPSLPGKLSENHSRTASAAESMTTDNLSLSMPPEPETPIWPLTLSFTVAIAAFSARFYFFTLFLLAATLYYMYLHRPDIHSKPDVMTPSLLALQHLISAGQLWDTVVNDTFAMLENEERSVFYGPASPLMPSSSLRVTLSTSLLTTQTQCDNVRQLLSAITSPSELAQLAEMYAPPSPMKPTFSPSADSNRPRSHPGPSPRATPQTDRMKKRSTWNGSYASLALTGTQPAFQLARRRERRRSDLSALLGTTSPTPARIQPQNTPPSPPQLLADVSEEEDAMVTAESSLIDEEEHSFGTAALGLCRNRIQGGLRALELSHRSTLSSLTRGDSTKRPTTMSPGSKYTSMHTRRHPFSLSSLHQSLQNALASKRFACSHLLALRFEDDEDEVYWEDVRSVMGLLTSTLVDASSRLSEVLDEVEERQLDDTISEGASVLRTPSSLASLSPPPARTKHPLSQMTEQIVSYGPTPSPVARFASHVDAISTALDDAREQLAQCVALLKEGRTVHRSPRHVSRSSHSSTSTSSDAALPPNDIGPESGSHGSNAFGEEPSKHPAIQAYERLRRELGLALRECERGRERLMYLIAPPTPLVSDEVATEAQHDDHADDAKGAQYDDILPRALSTDDVDVSDEAVLLAHVDLEPGRGSEPGLDDATVHPVSAGIEQVFEAESGSVGMFTRERSKLSREERIRLAKAEREHVRERGRGRGDTSVQKVGDDPFRTDGDVDVDSGSPLPSCERWGPSGDVVQELRDVIWKVGERRRKVTTAMMTMTMTMQMPTSMPVPVPMPVSVSVPVPMSVQTQTMSQIETVVSSSAVTHDERASAAS